MTTTTDTSRPRSRTPLPAIAALGAIAAGVLAIGVLVVAVVSAPDYEWTAGNVLWALLLIVLVAAVGAVVTAGARLLLGRS